MKMNYVMAACTLQIWLPLISHYFLSMPGKTDHTNKTNIYQKAFIVKQQTRLYKTELFPCNWVFFQETN